MAGKLLFRYSNSGFSDKLLIVGGSAMTIRVIYKDKTIGRVNTSRLDELIKMGRIAAFCFPNGEWVGVGHKPSSSGTAYTKGSLETVGQ